MCVLACTHTYEYYSQEEFMLKNVFIFTRIHNNFVKKILIFSNNLIKIHFGFEIFLFENIFSH
jgi:hypothetical protein